MAGTRRSARIASSQESQNSSPPQSQTSPKVAAGSKRKSEGGSSPLAKRGKKIADKEQKTLEETLEGTEAKETKHDKAEETSTATTNGAEKAKDEPPQSQTEVTGGEEPPSTKVELKSTHDAEPTPQDSRDAAPTLKDNQDAEPKHKDNQDEKKKEEQEEQQKSSSQPAANGDNAVVKDARTEEEPSSILEKGIIYFVYRGRVGIDSPSEVQDIARSYMVLRPIPAGAKLGDGPIGDDNNCRLIAIPKKVLPLSGKDRWIGFVEKAKTTMQDLKENFFAASDYETKTAGTRHTPAAVPAAEGVYAVTSTGRESHLAYIVTLPKSLGEVQNDLGLREQGSFIVSVKNPDYPGPANTDIEKNPGFSKDIMDTFRNLRWAPLRADMLDYEGCQFLLVGESGGLDSATVPQEDDQNKDKAEPKEELEKLGDEDSSRVKHLNNEDAIFKDLGTDAKSYPGLQTTW